MSCRPKEEVIQWWKVEDALPDDELTVMLFVPQASEPVWLGWKEGSEWFAADGSPLKDGTVVAWANMPGGPQ